MDQKTIKNNHICLPKVPVQRQIRLEICEFCLDFGCFIGHVFGRYLPRGCRYVTGKPGFVLFSSRRYISKKKSSKNIKFSESYRSRHFPKRKKCEIVDWELFKPFLWSFPRQISWFWPEIRKVREILQKSYTFYFKTLPEAGKRAARTRTSRRHFSRFGVSYFFQACFKHWNWSVTCS